MKPDWKQFLIDKGAEFEGTELVHFGNPERERRIPPQGAVLCDLSHLGLISASGIDTQTFLQGQLSNDIYLVTPTQAQLSSYSSPKGRAYTQFQIFLREGVYYLSLSSEVLEPVLKRLRMFVMRSQVALEDARESLVCFGYADPNAEQRLAQLLGSVPKQDFEVLQYNDLTIVRRPASIPRFEIFGELDAARDLWDKLNVHAAAVGRTAWDYLDIEAGLPQIHSASMEAWVPQMLNLHLLNAINFKKGCFSGQEVVARLKYLGKNKRQLYRLGINTFKLPAIGDMIQNESGEEAGKVLNASLNPDGKVEVLAVMKMSELDKPLLLNASEASVLKLPYSLEES